MAETEAQIGYGTTLEIASAVIPSVSYVEVAEVTSISPPAVSAETIDASHMKSPDKFKEYITGMKDGTNMTVDINYVPGSIGDQNIRAMQGEAKPRSVRIVWPNGGHEVFNAYLTNRTRAVPADGKMTSTLTFKVTGAITDEDPS